ncbi:class I SAM-dependent methyltransferase [Microbacterium sp. TNHR37B]|uniref:class I SAM-dependent methyltransferase n=1 Tax=Microbacterium sp. TNHR37B TaxID=1775956 RepID=UPI0007B27053|nr:class I SAM-dependent methyltransferase [Microbacterium sp. TNHR37B]KZE91337.1 putative methyltransferase [Microbacterium sp. TNHR37B]
MRDAQDLSRSFGRAADVYEAGRPDYPVEAVSWMLAPVGGAAPVRVADVGAGTGKLTRVLRSLGADVVAVDPDPEMLAALRTAVPGVPTLVGSAEALPLPRAGESVGALDAVVLGQAWHWVDPGAASIEVARVLRPGGVLGLVWNLRDERVPWVARLTAIMKGSHAEELLARGGPEVRPPFAGLEEQRWSWERPMTQAGLTAMVRSRSYVITAGAAERSRIEAEIAELFDEIGAVGDAEVRLPYVTRAFRARTPGRGEGGEPT